MFKNLLILAVLAVVLVSCGSGERVVTNANGTQSICDDDGICTPLNASCGAIGNNGSLNYGNNSIYGDANCFNQGLDCIYDRFNNCVPVNNSYQSGCAYWDAYGVCHPPGGYGRGYGYGYGPRRW